MLSVTPVPAFQDNYIWLIHDSHRAVVVDPGDAEVVERFLRDQRLELAGILITHHHQDHIGGLLPLTTRFAVPVWGPGSIRGVTMPVADGDQVRIPELAIELSVMEVPGHTLDHLAYYGSIGLFCGDTLFAVGCGRLFEGTAQQMFQSLSRLADLPPDTAVYCTHEYTLANERFATAVEPDNRDLQQRMLDDQHKRVDGLPTLPSHIGLERATNPFLRCGMSAVRAAVASTTGEGATPLAVFTALRAWKDQFR